MRYDEAFGSEPIRHAFRVTVRATNGYVFPASHRAGDTGALPMGARLRLKAAKDISGFAAPLRRIFQAMKTYGLIVADNGSDLYVSGTYDTRWDNDVLNPAFASLRGDDFEVVQLGWQPSGGPRLHHRHLRHLPHLRRASRTRRRSASRTSGFRSAFAGRTTTAHRATAAPSTSPPTPASSGSSTSRTSRCWSR